MKRRPRQIDVARQAGVSPATVSIVLNDRQNSTARIGAETRQRVLDAVAELGYVADPVAQSLAKGRNRLLGVFTYEPLFPIQIQDFYYRFLVGIEEEAEALGYDLLLFTSSRGTGGQRSIYSQGINRLRLADGAVLLGVERDKSELTRLVDEGYPFVYVGRREMPAAQIAYVAADYATATAEIVAHMVAHGHKRIAYLGQIQRTESHTDRYTGYVTGCQDAGLTVDEELTWFGPPEEIRPPLIQRLQSLGATAILLEHDRPAHFLLQAAAQLDLKIPADLSIATLGDPLTEFEGHPDITTFRIPRRRMGIQAVRLLVEMLEAPTAPLRQITLACDFMPGVTVAPPNL